MRKEQEDGFHEEYRGFTGTPARFAREARMRCAGETRLREGAGHDRVRDSGRRARGDSDYRHNGVSSEAPRTVERDSGGYQQLVGDERGQASVEYALVVVAMLSVVVAVGAIANVLERGVFVEHALASAAYHVTASVGWIADVFGC